MVMPPVQGFTPFWEKELGLVYATNKDAREMNLSVGCSIRFEVSSVTGPRNSSITIAHNISNV
jgi:hypothetical protein